MSDSPTLARQLQIRAWMMFGFNYTKQVALGTGYTREYISRLFNERVPLTEEATQRIEAALEEAELERKAA